MSEAVWIDVGSLEEVPQRGARVVRTERGDLAVFRSSADEIFVLDDHCPHRGGPLSQGIVHGRSVTCPLHNWVIDLATGKALGTDEGCTRTIAVKLEDGRIKIDLATVRTRVAA